MRQAAVCPECIEVELAAGKQPKPIPALGEIADSGFIRVKCAQGHQGIVIFNARRDEVLLRSAARAYVDGYTNEVVAVASAALERAYEFHIKVACRAKRIPQADLDSAWKSVSSQSERQLGAFQFLFLLNHGRNLRLDPSIVETRNNVVHKGRIASGEEAVAFAELVVQRISEIEGAIEESFQAEARDEALREVEVQRALVPPETKFVQISVQAVHVDKETRTVTGRVRTFLDLAATELQSRKSGFPY